MRDNLKIQKLDKLKKRLSRKPHSGMWEARLKINGEPVGHESCAGMAIGLVTRFEFRSNDARDIYHLEVKACES